MFRAVTPSLEAFAQMVLDPESAASRLYLDFYRRFSGDARAEISDAVNSIFYLHGHRHVYREPELVAMLAEAGFVELRPLAAGSYGDPVFDGVDGHGNVIGSDVNAVEAFAIEGRKPVQS
jgi:hypothetical protein